VQQRVVIVAVRYLHVVATNYFVTLSRVRAGRRIGFSYAPDYFAPLQDLRICSRWLFASSSSSTTTPSSFANAGGTNDSYASHGNVHDWIRPTFQRPVRQHCYCNDSAFIFTTNDAPRFSEYALQMGNSLMKSVDFDLNIKALCGIQVVNVAVRDNTFQKFAVEAQASHCQVILQDSLVCLSQILQLHEVYAEAALVCALLGRDKGIIITLHH